MKTVGIIPSRWGSTRFPGKSLALIAGKPLVLHVLERCRRAKLLDDVIVATDDRRIAEVVEKAGGWVEMTSPDHPTGSDRLAEVARRIRCQWIVNIQGDEPLIQPGVINSLVRAIQKNRKLPMATMARRISDPEMIRNPNVVKVVSNSSGNALYFSRSPIPYLRNPEESAKYYQHIGIYAYQQEFLLKFVRMKQTALEQSEKLEQLRVLENGFDIHVVETKHESIGVDIPEDILKVENYLLKARPSALKK